MLNQAAAAAPDTGWKTLYKIGGIAALISVLMIPFQIAIFIISPPPTTIPDWLALFQDNWLMGLLGLDLLYIITNTLMILIFLALYISLRQADQSLMAVALSLGFIGIAAYFASNPSFEMLALSNQFAAAGTEAEANIFLAAGHTLIAQYTGTAFDVYYVFNAIALIIMSAVMLKSSVYSKKCAYWGLAAGALMIIPSSAGTVGMVFAMVSLVPWIGFALLISKRLRQLGRV